MDGFSVISVITDIREQIYALWGNAILNNSAQAKNKINKILERNAERLITKSYSKQGYRARIVSPGDYSDLVLEENNKVEKMFSGDSGIHGFSADKMGAAPIEKIKDGRANKAETSCLYLASDISTACAEVQPCCQSLISVIEFFLTSDMSLIDLRNIPEILSTYNSKEDVEKLIDIIFCESLLYFFSMPVSSRNSNEYGFSQYISDYFSQKDVDGILYSSSHNYNDDAYNIVLFDPTKATPNEQYGELFKCLSIKTTFQSVSKKCRTIDAATILEAKREEAPLKWNEILLLHKELTESQQNCSQSNETPNSGKH